MTIVDKAWDILEKLQIMDQRIDRFISSIDKTNLNQNTRAAIDVDMLKISNELLLIIHSAQMSDQVAITDKIWGIIDKLYAIDQNIDKLVLSVDKINEAQTEKTAIVVCVVCILKELLLSAKIAMEEQGLSSLPVSGEIEDVREVL